MDQELEIYEGFSLNNKPEVEFALHQSYEEPGSTKQVKCAECGAAELEVGFGSYCTVVRCPRCRHEAIIHDG